MLVDLSKLETIMNSAVPGVAPAGQLAVLWQGNKVFSRPYGWLDPDSKERQARTHTLFDIASITKLFTAAAFLRLTETGRVELDQPVSSLLPDFAGVRAIRPFENPEQPGTLKDFSAEQQGPVDAGRVTFRQLLSHSAGLPPVLPLKDQPDAVSARQMALETDFAYRPGTRCVYSDVGMMLVGWSVEKLTGLTLDEAVAQLITEPLGLEDTRFIPLGNFSFPPEIKVIAPTELDPWRQRRLVGEVHDENAWRLEGVAGHAGLFSNAEDLAEFGQIFLNGGQPVFQPGTVSEATRLQAETDNRRYGLGFMLRSPDPESSGYPFSQVAFGHTGFTGASLWVDPERELVVAIVTNSIYYSRERGGLQELRLQVHQAVVDAVDRATSSLTEMRNPRSQSIDRLSTLEMVQIINEEDQLVAQAVVRQLPQIARAIDAIAERMRQGGRLIYVGAGTSGRLGVLDASEMPPTFGVPPEQVIGVLAGGPQAVSDSIEDAEDLAEGGAQALIELQVGRNDTVLGIAASGHTPFVVGALQEAQRRGALTISLACNRPSTIQQWAEIHIAPLVGPEVITGSTRMKAGTAQKMTLNMISTGVMVKLGKTYGNLMVDVQPGNIKLRKRARRIVSQACEISEEQAGEALERAGGEVKTAIMMVRSGLEAGEARQRLQAAGGSVRRALEET